MFFANQVSQCAKEGAGLGWSECHCEDFVVEVAMFDKLERVEEWR